MTPWRWILRPIDPPSMDGTQARGAPPGGPGGERTPRPAPRRRWPAFLIEGLLIAGLLVPIVRDEIDPPALREAAAAYGRNDLETALRRALDHLDRRPASRAAALLAARCLSRLDFAEKAEPYYRRAGPLGLDDLHIRAYGLVRANRREEAVGAYQDILARRPDDVLALRRLAAVRIAQARRDEALALADRLIRIPSGAVIGHTLAGVVHHDTESPERAVAAFERVLALDPDLRLMPLNPRSMFWTYLAQDLLALGRPAEARRGLARALSGSGDATLAGLMGQAYRQEGDFDEAERWLAPGVGVGPDARGALVEPGSADAAAGSSRRGDRPAEQGRRGGAEGLRAPLQPAASRIAASAARPRRTGSGPRPIASVASPALRPTAWEPSGVLRHDLETTDPRPRATDARRAGPVDPGGDRLRRGPPATRTRPRRPAARPRPGGRPRGGRRARPPRRRSRADRLRVVDHPVPRRLRRRPGSRSSTAAATARRSTSPPPTAAAWPCSTTTATAGSTSTSPRPANLPLDAPTGRRATGSTGTGATGRSRTSTERAGVGFRGFTHGVAVGDVDNDG